MVQALRGLAARLGVVFSTDLGWAVVFRFCKEGVRRPLHKHLVAHDGAKQSMTLLMVTGHGLATHRAVAQHTGLSQGLVFVKVSYQSPCCLLALLFPQPLQGYQRRGDHHIRCGEELDDTAGIALGLGCTPRSVRQGGTCIVCV